MLSWVSVLLFQSEANLQPLLAEPDLLAPCGRDRRSLEAPTFLFCFFLSALFRKFQTQPSQTSLQSQRPPFPNSPAVHFSALLGFVFKIAPVLLKGLRKSRKTFCLILLEISILNSKIYRSGKQNGYRGQLKVPELIWRCFAGSLGTR